MPSRLEARATSGGKLGAMHDIFLLSDNYLFVYFPLVKMVLILFIELGKTHRGKIQ